MSYAPIRSASAALGQASVGLIAAGSVVCEGDVWDAAGACCPDREWHNIVYLSVKGALSLRYHNEKRVRHALNLLSAAHLEDARWRLEGDLDRPVALDPKFVRGAALAARNYHALYPVERWYRVPDAIAAIRMPPKATCGPFNAWSAYDVPHTAEWQRAWSAVTAAAPGDVDPGVTVIATVPGSHPEAERQSMPREGELFEVSGSTLGPSPWTAAFLDDFAPGWRGMMIERAALLRVREEPTRPLSTRALRTALRLTTEPAAPTAPAAGPPWLLLGAGAAVLAAAGGYYYWTKR